jgi:hypothetical protein
LKSTLSSLSARPDVLRALTARPFAHRGLHGPRVSENGMAAFAAAVAGQYGIECDVRLSRDGVPMVFHDAALARMTGRARLAIMMPRRSISSPCPMAAAFPACATSFISAGRIRPC